MKDRLVKPSDVVFTAVIVAVCILVWFFALPQGGGDTVVVRMDGELIASLPLGQDTEYEIAGEYTNILEIKDGSVRITYTDCPNHQCEKTGGISAAGSAIVCAPNHVSITIDGKGAGVDAVTG